MGANKPQTQKDFTGYCSLCGRKIRDGCAYRLRYCCQECCEMDALLREDEAFYRSEIEKKD
jgi:hypothetical protein